MEIYKITDNIPVKKRGGRCSNFSKAVESNRDDDCDGVLKITDIKQAVKNENRVNIFINGRYEFSLDITQLLDFKLKIGKIIDATELERYKKASEYGKLYQRTLEWVLARPHSVKETRDYLRKKVFEKELDESFIEEIIGRLLKKRYLDDGKYASYYIENRFTNKGISRRRLEMELFKKGIDKVTIDEALGGSERNDEDEILKIIAKKRAKYDDEKLINYLCRQGFSFELVRSLVLAYEKD